jgi:hypothetical protein
LFTKNRGKQRARKCVWWQNELSNSYQYLLFPKIAQKIFCSHPTQDILRYNLQCYNILYGSVFCLCEQREWKRAFRHDDKTHAQEFRLNLFQIWGGKLELSEVGFRFFLISKDNTSRVIRHLYLPESSLPVSNIYFLPLLT